MKSESKKKPKNNSSMETADKLYKKTLNFLSFRPRSEKEVRDYLEKNKSDDVTALRIIQNLKENKFLDDIEFTKWWIEQRTLLRPRAWRVIEFELKRKGIPDEIIQNSELRIQTDLETALKLAEKKMVRFKNLPKEEIYQKLGRYLASKGFDWDIIKEVIDHYFHK